MRRFQTVLQVLLGGLSEGAWLCNKMGSIYPQRLGYLAFGADTPIFRNPTPKNTPEIPRNVAHFSARY